MIKFEHTKRDTRVVCAQRDGHVKKQQEGGHQQAKERGFRGNQLYWHHNLELQASRTVKNSCWLIHPVGDILLWQPQQMNTDFRAEKWDAVQQTPRNMKVALALGNRWILKEF